MWDESRLYIVLEFLDVDLRQHIESSRGLLRPQDVKVSIYLRTLLSLSSILTCPAFC